MDKRPELYSDLFWIWESFITLSQCREHGFSGPQAIRFSEIKAFADEISLTDLETRARFFARIQLLDRTLIEYLDQKDNGKK